MTYHKNTGFRKAKTAADGSAVTSSVGAEGKQALNTVFGELTVGQRVDDISCQFQYNNATRDVTSTATGTGSTANIDAEAYARTGTGVGAASLVSVDSTRYRPGHECVTMFTSEYLGAPDANSYMQHGLFNGDNGFYFGYKGTEFGCFMLKGAVETFYPQTAWSHDKFDGSGGSGFDLDPSKLNIYKITYGWLGIAPVFFSVYTGIDKGWVTCHVLDFANIQNGPHINNPSLPMTMRVGRTSGTGNNLSIGTCSWRSGMVGESDEDNNSNRVFSYTVLSKVVGTTETPIMTLRNNTTFQGKTNHTRAELMIVRFTTDGSKAVAFKGRKGATLTGATYAVTPDASNSAFSIDTAATAFTGGTEGAATVLAKVDSLRADVRGTGLIVLPGQTFTITGQAAGTTSDVSVSVRWVEYF